MLFVLYHFITTHEHIANPDITEQYQNLLKTPELAALIPAPVKAKAAAEVPAALPSTQKKKKPKPAVAPPPPKIEKSAFLQKLESDFNLTMNSAAYTLSTQELNEYIKKIEKKATDLNPQQIIEAFRSNSDAPPVDLRDCETKAPLIARILNFCTKKLEKDLTKKQSKKTATPPEIAEKTRDALVAIAAPFKEEEAAAKIPVEKRHIQEIAFSHNSITFAFFECLIDLYRALPEQLAQIFLVGSQACLADQLYNSKIDEGTYFEKMTTSDTDLYLVFNPLTSKAEDLILPQVMSHIAGHKGAQCTSGLYRRESDTAIQNLTIHLTTPTSKCIPIDLILYFPPAPLSGEDFCTKRGVFSPKASCIKIANEGIVHRQERGFIFQGNHILYSVPGPARIIPTTPTPKHIGYIVACIALFHTKSEDLLHDNPALLNALYNFFSNPSSEIEIAQAEARRVCNIKNASGIAEPLFCGVFQTMRETGCALAEILPPPAK